MAQPTGYTSTRKKPRFGTLVLIALLHVLAIYGLAKAFALANDIADNASLVNYLIVQSIARINDMSRADGLYAESLSAALSQTGADAKEGLMAFLEKRKPNFR